MITENDIGFLTALFRYCYLTRPQIQALRCPQHKQGRTTRKRLEKLFRGGYVNKHRMLIPHGTNGNGMPVYYLTKAGAELLAAYFDDERYLHSMTRRPRADMLLHWIAISETHIRLDAAVAGEEDVAIEGWVNEWEVVNKEASDTDHYFLHTVFRAGPHPLSCSPDAGFLLNCRGFKRVMYLEQDRGTSGVNQIAASKTPGYSELHRRQGHRKHFPETIYEDFTVLMVTTNPGRRNQLARAVSKKERSELWLFASQDELTADTFLYGSVTYSSTGTVGALLKRA